MVWQCPGLAPLQLGLTEGAVALSHQQSPRWRLCMQPSHTLTNFCTWVGRDCLESCQVSKQN